MPGLLDLPSELIDHIFLYEESVKCIRQAYEDEDGTEYVVTAPLSRLASRYFEQCTRHNFAKAYFRTRRIKMFEDASIKRFCDLAHFPELIRYVTELEFHVADDQHERREMSSVTRNDLVDALRAYPAMREFAFCDAAREQTDELHQEDRTEGDLEISGCRNSIDMSSSFSFVLSAAEEAGMRPRWITSLSRDPSAMPHGGLADCFALAERNQVVSEVEQLGIDIVPPRPEHGNTPGNMGIRLAEQLEAGLFNMPALKTLELSFHTSSASSISAWDILANVPKFANLEELVLHGCSINLRDMTRFILQQADTLKYLDLSRLYLHECTLTDISLFYRQLSIVSTLEEYRQNGLALVTVTGNRHWVRYIGLPGHLCVVAMNGVVNEDGYINIWIWKMHMHWEGCGGIKAKLSDLSVCLF